jgi:hypothetical protein
LNRFSPTVIALVAANLFPLYGVLALGWEVFPIMLLFWMENLIIGGFNALKMLCAAPQDRMKWLGKLFLVPFFSFHYGCFTLVHGVFVFGLFGGAFRQGAPFPGWSGLARQIGELHLGYAVLALVASHAFAFGYTYLWRGEYRTASLKELMQAPYGRVAVLHLTLLGGGILVNAMHSPTAGLILLVALKIFFDVRSHEKERRRVRPQARPGRFNLSPVESTFPPRSSVP